MDSYSDRDSGKQVAFQMFHKSYSSTTRRGISDEELGNLFKSLEMTQSITWKPKQKIARGSKNN